MIRLSQIKAGERVEVLDIPKRCPLRMTLRQYGITPGSILSCRYCSPGEELAALEYEGSVVALRLSELSEITVRYCP